jgi:protein-disulfide isomerase
MSKQFWAVIVVVILSLFAIFTFSGKNSTNSNTSSSKASAQPTSHIEGKGTTGVTLVEYGDYECPYCGQYYPTVKAVQAHYGDAIRFQFRNFPLVNSHQNAFAAARAAEAAALQNKFWEMHDALYANQQQWSTSSNAAPIFDQYATQLQLNLTQFKQDYASIKVNDLINADTAAGTKLNVQGTPSYYLDGKPIQVANTTAAFAKVIDAEIAQKNPTSKTP